MKKMKMLAEFCNNVQVAISPSLRFFHIGDVDLAILLSDAISIETFPSFQIATAGDNVKCFLACVNTTLPALAE
jgi:hypothetical protein